MVDVYYDLRMLSSNYSDTVIDAVVGFTRQNDSLADDALFVFYTHNTTVSADIYAMTVHVNIMGDEKTTTAMDAVKKLPVLYSNTVIERMADAALNSQIHGGTRFVYLPFWANLVSLANRTLAMSDLH